MLTDHSLEYRRQEPEGKENPQPQPQPQQEAEETRPLSPKTNIQTKEPTNVESDEDDEVPFTKAATPIPQGRLKVLCALVIFDSFALSQLSVYVPFLVRHMLNEGDDEIDSQVAIFTGLLVAAYPTAQTMGSWIWGYSSDRVGRRPIMLLCQCLHFLALCGFAFSTSLSSLFIFRFCGGLINGSTLIIRPYLGEITDKTNQARCFAQLIRYFAVGIALGPLTAGFLYNPQQDPFQSQFWYSRPQFLINIIAAALVFIGILLTLKFLPETSRAHKDKGCCYIYKLPEIQHRDTGQRISMIRALFSNITFLVCMTEVFIVAWSFLTYQTVFPLWASVQIEDGGWGLSAFDIGIVTSIGNVGLFIMQTFLYFHLVNRFGLKGSLRGLWVVHIICMLAFPLLQFVHDSTTRIVIGAIYMIPLVSSTGAIATASWLLVTNSVQSFYLGTMNGVGSAFVSVARACGPLAGGALFAASLNKEHDDFFGRKVPLFNRYSIFWLMGLMGIIGLSLISVLPDTIEGPKDTLYEAPTEDDVSDKSSSSGKRKTPKREHSKLLRRRGTHEDVNIDDFEAVGAAQSPNLRRVLTHQQSCLVLQT